MWHIHDEGLLGSKKIYLLQTICDEQNQQTEQDLKNQWIGRKTNWTSLKQIELTKKLYESAETTPYRLNKTQQKTMGTSWKNKLSN